MISVMRPSAMHIAASRSRRAPAEKGAERVEVLFISLEILGDALVEMRRDFVEFVREYLRGNGALNNR